MICCNVLQQMKRFTILIITMMSLCCTGGIAQSVYPGQHKEKIKVVNVAVPTVTAFDMRDVRLLPGRIHDNVARDSAWMANISIKRLTHSFKNNAGVYAALEGGYESVKKFGGWESLDCDLRGHTTGHLMSAYGLMYATTGDPIFKAKGDSIVATLAEVQDVLGNGYLSAYPEELINRNLRGQGVWAPWYTLHKIMSGLIDQYLLADNRQALDVAVRMGDWAYRKLISQSEDTRRLMLRNEFGGMNEAFYNLYSVTGEERYKQLGEYFYHNDVIDPLAEGNTDFGTRHTNTFIPKVIGEIRKYELTGSPGSLGIARLFFNEVTDKHIFATGECSQKEHFFDPARMSEYLNGYTGETCCTYNMLKLARHLFCNDADPRTADFYERALYNHILAQQDTESGMVCYFLPLLTGAYKVYSTPEQSFWCCVGSGFESHAKYAESIYFKGNNKLLVNLFIPSVINWAEKGLRIKQTTRFPDEETTVFDIEEAPYGNFSISLRFPGWSGKPEIRVNGKKVNVKGKPSSYITLNRTWHKGDRIEVRYPMTLRVETTPDNPTRGALLYGPVVLAGDLGTEGIKNNSFSDPTVRNDYYTYNFDVPDNLPTTLNIDPRNPSAKVIRTGKGLEFEYNGQKIRPLYDINHCRYVVYWNLK